MASDAGDDEAFRLLSIRPTSAPSGQTGRNWLIYEIAQGENIIKGYRQGDLKAETAEVEKIVVSLNERRHSPKGRRGPKPGGRPAAQASAPAAESGDDE
jgi:hypothetical protein